MDKSLVIKTMQIFEKHKWNDYVPGLDYVDEVYNLLKLSLDYPNKQHEALKEARDIMERYYLQREEPLYFRELQLYLLK